MLTANITISHTKLYVAGTQNNLSSFTHPQVVPKQYEFLYFNKLKRRSFEE